MAEAEQISGQTRVRSPAYPNIGLKESIDKVAALYHNEGQGRHPIPISSVARRWDYNSVNGSALAAISALKQFGLIEDVADCDPRQFRLTPRAITIVVRSAESPERSQAIREAALLPKLYSGLLAKFPLPLPSDDTLREHFILELRFNAKQVAGAIKDFKEAISFAKLDLGVNLLFGNKDKKKDDEPAALGTGDFVLWDSQGVAQWTEPRRVTGKDSKDGVEWVFVEGSQTGIRAAELTRVEPPAAKDDLSEAATKNLLGPGGFFGAATPPPNPNYKPAAQNIGAKQDVFTLPEGPVVFQYPGHVGSDSFEDLKSWMELQLRKIGRSITPARPVLSDEAKAK